MNPVESPCVNICVMHPAKGLCVGCYRTINEIIAWGGMTQDQRRAIMEQLPERKLLLKKRRDT